MAKKLSVRDIEAKFKQMAAGSKRLLGSFDDVVGIAFEHGELGKFLIRIDLEAKGSGFERKHLASSHWNVTLRLIDDAKEELPMTGGFCYYILRVQEDGAMNMTRRGSAGLPDIYRPSVDPIVLSKRYDEYDIDELLEEIAKVLVDLNQLFRAELMAEEARIVKRMACLREEEWKLDKLVKHAVKRIEEIGGLKNAASRSE